jgi:hypothetical protein
MHTQRSNWLTPAALIALSAVPAVMGTLRLASSRAGRRSRRRTRGSTPRRSPWVLHILAAIPFSIVGRCSSPPPFAGVRGIARGRLLAPAGWCRAITGAVDDAVLPVARGRRPVLYLERLLFGPRCVVSIVLALAAVRRRDFAAHGAWMTRGYAIGLGAGTQVLSICRGSCCGAGRPGELPRAVMLAPRGSSTSWCRVGHRRGGARRPAPPALRLARA